MAALTWLHLSDWHQGGTEFDRNFVRDKLLPDIRACRDDYPELNKINLVFFTGDLASSGKKSEFQEAQSALLDPVLDATGCEKNDLFLIPGNHDLNRETLKLLADHVRKKPASRNDIQELLQKGPFRRLALEPFWEYQEWIDDYGAAGFGAFGDAKMVCINSSCNLGIVGFNSAIFCGRNLDTEKEVHDYGYLAVGIEQVHNNLLKVEDADLKIGLIHHPFSWLRDFDADEVERELRRECHFILRGHEHSNEVKLESSIDGTGVVIRGGACYNGLIPDRPRRANAYNFVHFNSETGLGVVYFRRWDDAQQRWIADHEKGSAGLFPFVLPIASSARLNMLTVPATDTISSSESLSADVKQVQTVDLESLRQTYLKYVCQRWENLELRGIMQTGKADVMPLDEVYVSLTAQKGPKDSLLPPNEQLDYEWSAVTRTADVNIDWTDKSHLTVRRRLAAIEGPNLERVEISRTLRENFRLVVLGDPGAGKTTLARFVARLFALACLRGNSRVLASPATYSASKSQIGSIPLPDDYGEPKLPLILRVADYAEALRLNGNLRLRDFLCSAGREAGILEADARVLFEDALTRGNVIVILDGLDEVAQTTDRVAIARRIDDFAHEATPANRILVTSRIGGYGSARLNAGFGEYTIRNMEFGQIEQFVRRWVVAYERAKTNEMSDEQIRKRAELDIASIIDAVRHNDGVKRLAVNPLLLTILCLIYRTGARLPERRVELYSLASKTLLEDWRPSQTGQANCIVPMAEADRLLAPLADWMHEYTERGLIPEEKARDLLHEFCAARNKLAKDDPHVDVEVEKFWRGITYDTSVFVERSQGEYAFLHLTFEEYWAARYLVRDYNLAAERLRGRRHNPRFEEVVLLAVASQTEDNAANLIRAAIWCPEEQAAQWGYVASRYEKIFRRDLLLAARCIGDCAGVEPILARMIAGELADICLNRHGKGEFQPLVDKAKNTLKSVRGSVVSTYAVQMFMEALKDEDSEVQSLAIRAIEVAVPGSSELVHALLATLNRENDALWSTVTQVIVTVGEVSSESVRVLLAFLRDEDSYVRSVAARALETAGQGSPDVVRALLTALKDEDSIVRSAAAGSLGTSGQGSSEVVQSLLSALQDKESQVRSAAAESLGTVGQSSPEVVQALLTALNDQDSNVRSAAIFTLGTVDRSSIQSAQALIALLNDEDYTVRFMAAFFLGIRRQGPSEVMDALLMALKDESRGVRFVAAVMLGMVGPGSTDLLQALLTALEDEKSYARAGAADALRMAGQGSSEVVQALLTALQDRESQVRFAAVGALGTVGQASPEVVQALLTALNDQDDIVRFAAAESLGMAGHSSPEVVQVLLTALNDKDSNVRSAAVGALGTAGQGSPEVVRALLEALRQEDSNVRSAAAEALGTAGHGSTEVAQALIATLNDADIQVRNAAWEAAQKAMAD